MSKALAEMLSANSSPSYSPSCQRVTLHKWRLEQLAGHGESHVVRQVPIPCHPSPGTHGSVSTAICV